MVVFKTTFRNVIYDTMRKRGWKETEDEKNWDFSWVEKDWMAEVRGWRDASRVMLDMRRATAEPSYVGDALRAIPASAVDAMRATIHKRAGAFRYSLEDVRGDAVHVLLRGIAAAA